MICHRCSHDLEALAGCPPGCTKEHLCELCTELNTLMYHAAKAGYTKDQVDLAFRSARERLDDHIEEPPTSRCSHTLDAEGKCVTCALEAALVAGLQRFFASASERVRRGSSS